MPGGVDLSGRVALVMGGTRGIGEAIARRFLDAGAAVVAAGRTAEERATGAPVVMKGDVGIKADVDRVVTATLDRFGAVDILVNCAGVIRRRPVVETSEADWTFMVDVNLKGVLLACQALERTKFSMFWPLRTYRHLYDRGEELLRAVGVWEQRDETIKNLSHGIQRQLEVALALAGKPRLLLLDEPMAGLSPAETHDMTELLRKLDRSMTLLIIEHDMDVVLDLAENIAVLHLGRKIADGSKEAVRANREVQEIYLGVA